MEKEHIVDYFQAVREFDLDQGKKPDSFAAPLRDSVVSDGVVDYLTVSREYERYRNAGNLDVIHNEKK